MRLTLDLLRRYTDLPADPQQARVLLDTCGLEVKRIDPSAPGVPLTLELLANRGDHHALVGIARELSGRTGEPLRAPQTLTLEVGDPPHPVRVETDLCPVYTLTPLTRVREGALPADASALLDACGLHAVSPAVDATNAVNLELGQPTHAFDADAIEGPIVVRLSRAGERAHPLFQPEPVELPEGTMVIADDAKILAIAGVIGCEESKTTDATTRVLLESAHFDPVAVRKASRALNLHTDSSARFERGSDPTAPLRGAARVAELLLAAGWEVSGPSGVVSSWVDPIREIPLRPDHARRFLGVRLADDEIAERLRRYGFEVTPGAPMQVRVPPHRLWDVEFEADVLEELAKSLGYDATPTELPPIDMGALPTAAESARAAADEVLTALGLYEVITDGFYARGLRDKLGIAEGHPCYPHVETSNALDRAYSLLKRQCLGQAVEAVATGQRLMAPEVKAFEHTRVFIPDASAANGVCRERRVLWAVASGLERPRTWAGAPRPADALFMKGVVAELSASLGLDLRLVRPGAEPAAEHELSDRLHPGRALCILQGDACVGLLGEVHPEVLAAFKLKKVRPVYLELDADALLQRVAAAAYVEPPSKHPIERSLAFTLPHGVEAGAVADILAHEGPSWLDRVQIVDLYAHDGLRTFTYELRFSHGDAERTADEVNAACEALIAAVESGMASQGVVLRR